MQKKTVALFLFIITLLAGVPFVHAESPSITLSEPTITTVGSQAQVVFTGTINDAMRDYLSSTIDAGIQKKPAVSPLLVRYARIPDLGKTPDLSHLSDETHWGRCILGENKGGCGIQNNNFTLKLSNFTNGTYFYDAGVYDFTKDSDGVWVPFIPVTAIGEQETDFPTFDVIIKTPSVTFQSVSVSENTVAVKLNFKNISIKNGVYVELGYAKQKGQTSVYSCSPAGIGLGTSSLSKDIDLGDSSVEFTITDVADGYYCVRLASILLKNASQEVDGDGFFMTKGALFSVGNVRALDPGATISTSANDLGCVYKKDNKSYCLLAPLPGVGDTTGKLDVTKGIGNYFNMIIKLVMGIIGVLAVLMVVVGGIEYMSTVNLGEKEGARARITSAILGLLLALSAYLILKTINPDLVNVNIGVPEGTIVQEEEFSETSTSGSGVSISKSQVTIAIPGSVSDMAKQLLNNSNVSFSGYANNAAKKDLQAMADGKQIIRQDGSKGPPLSEKMLAGLLSMAKTMPIKIGVLESAHHNSGPNGHWGGRGVDFQIVHGGGKPAKNTKANLDYDKKLMEACVAGGAIPTQVFGPCTDDFSYTSSLKLCPYTQFNSNIDHSNHVHCGW